MVGPERPDALERDVVDGEGGPQQPEVTEALFAVTEGQQEAGVPIVEMDDIDRPPVRAQGLQGGPAEQPEPPGVVRIVTGGVAVEPLAIERGRVHLVQHKPAGEARAQVIAAATMKAVKDIVGFVR